VKQQHIKEASSAGISTATDSEPDFGNWLAAGKVRKLGAEMNGASDKWFRSGGYTQTQFIQADDIWGGKFDELTAFNLDPGIYRKSATEKLKVPPTWSNFATPDEAEPLPKPNSVTADGDTDTEEEFDDINVKIPKYRDFF
jgi:hypothetical protein